MRKNNKDVKNTFGNIDKSKIKIEKQLVTDSLRTNYMPYAMSVIISRAIPEIDGFKPAHRKLLYTMYNMGLLNSGAKYTKSANIVGQGMKLNPHGDATIYETMVRLTDANEALLFPFVDAKGSFGKHYSRDMAPAAARYTEARLCKSCELIFGDIEKNAVEFIPNYDGTMKEPVLLPSVFPNILVNPNQGIAVGMASNICSFNLKEVCEATMELIKNKNYDVLEKIKGPDFPTGGIYLYNEKELKDVCNTGRGTFKIRSVYSYDKKSNRIEITQIPYSTTVELIIDKVIDLVKNNKIREVSDIRDETDLTGLKIAIDLKKGSDPDKLMNKLFKMTSLEDTFSCNFNILVNGNPKVLGISDIIKEWIIFRIGCIKNKSIFELNKKKNRLHLLEGLSAVSLNIDKVIKIIRNTEKDTDVVPTLMEKFKIDEKQANYIAEIKLRNLNKEYILNLLKDINSLNKDIEELENIISDEKLIKKIIIKELQGVIKKYEIERKTKVTTEIEEIEISEEQDDDAYNVVVFITKEGYLKKITPISLRSSGEHKLKENDEIVYQCPCMSNAELLVFNDKAEVYKVRLSEFEDSKASLLGEYIPAKVGMSVNEKYVFSCILVPGKDLIFFYENGKVGRVPMDSYLTKTNRKKLSNAYSEKSKIINIVDAYENEYLIITSNKDKKFIIGVNRIPSKTTRNNGGVAVLKTNTKVTLLSGEKTDVLREDLFCPKSLPSTGK